jgi:hypothetical protein
MSTGLLLAVLVVVAVLAGLALATRRRRPQVPRRADWLAGEVREGPASQQPISSTPARYRNDQRDDDPGGLRVGQKVMLSGRAGTVLATIGFTEDVYAWTSALIGHGTSRDWLTIVTETSGLEIVRWRRLPVLPGSPDDPSVDVEGTTYLFEESGEARFDAHGEVDLPGTGTVRYVDFKAGPRRLSFENYEGYGWEASVGEVVPLGELVRRA